MLFESFLFFWSNIFCYLDYFLCMKHFLKIYHSSNLHLLWNHWIEFDETFTGSLLHDAVVHLFNFSSEWLFGLPFAKHGLLSLVSQGGRDQFLIHNSSETTEWILIEALQILLLHYTIVHLLFCSSFWMTSGVFLGKIWILSLVDQGGIIF